MSVEPVFDFKLLQLLADYDDLLTQLQESMKEGFTSVSKGKYFYSNKGSSSYAGVGYDGVEEKFHSGLELHSLVHVDCNSLELQIGNGSQEADQETSMREEVIENIKTPLEDVQSEKLRNRHEKNPVKEEKEPAEDSDLLKKQSVDPKHSQTAVNKRQLFLSKLKYDPIMVYNQGDLFGSSSSGNKLKTLKQTQLQFRESLEIMVKLQLLKQQIMTRLSSTQ